MTIQHIMRTRPLVAAVTLVAGILVALPPAGASAGPAPDPTRHQVATSEPVLCPTPQPPPTSCRDAVLAHFVAAYRSAPLWDKHRIHNEIMMILADPEITCG